MEMLVLGICIVLAAVVIAKSQERYHIKPRISRFNITVLGRTEQDEQMTIQFPIFVDEGVESAKAKLADAFAIRESRLKEQNERLLAAQEEHKRGLEMARDEKLRQIKASEEAAKKVEEAPKA